MFHMELYDYNAEYTRDTKIIELKKEIEILERKVRRLSKEKTILETELRKRDRLSQERTVEVVSSIFHKEDTPK